MQCIVLECPPKRNCDHYSSVMLSNTLFKETLLLLVTVECVAYAVILSFWHALSYLGGVGAISLLPVGVGVGRQCYWLRSSREAQGHPSWGHPHPQPSADQPEAHIFTTLSRSQESWLGVCEDLTELTRPWMKPARTSGARVSPEGIAIQPLFSRIFYLCREATCCRVQSPVFGI